MLLDNTLFKIKRAVFGMTADIIMSFPSRKIREWYCRLFFNSVGTNVYFGRYIDIREPSLISIGDNVVVNKRVLLDGRGRLTIRDNVDIAQDVYIWTMQHDYNNDNHSLIIGDVIIDDHVWLCARATILPGIKIGKGAVVATGAVVTKNVASLAIVGGVPAKFIANRENNLKYILSYKPTFYSKI